MNTKLLKVLEDLHEIRVHLERKRFSTVQRRRIDRAIRTIRNMLSAGNPVEKPRRALWIFLRSTLGYGLFVKSMEWIARLVESIIQSE